MKEFKGTKGEWSYQLVDEKNEPCYYILCNSINGWGEWVGDAKQSSVRDNDDSKTLANAKLIAAAPDLLEALQELTDRLEINYNDLRFSQRIAIVKAKKAIEKALK